MGIAEDTNTRAAAPGGQGAVQVLNSADEAELNFMLGGGTINCAALVEVAKAETMQMLTAFRLYELSIPSRCTTTHIPPSSPPPPPPLRAILSFSYCHRSHCCCDLGLVLLSRLTCRPCACVGAGLRFWTVRGYHQSRMSNMCLLAKLLIRRLLFEANRIQLQS